MPKPVAVIECEASNVYLDLKAKEQMLDCCDLICADYAMLNNGIQQICFKYGTETDSCIELVDLPSYMEMHLVENFLDHIDRFL